MKNQKLEQKLECYRLDNFAITVDKHGADRFTKASYPVRYGRYGEIKTDDYLFEFNLNGEIKTIRGLNGNWPHPAEWLKRTAANDWVYYSVGRYHRLFSFKIKRVASNHRRAGVGSAARHPPCGL